MHRTASDPAHGLGGRAQIADCIRLIFESSMCVMRRGDRTVTLQRRKSGSSGSGEVQDVSIWPPRRIENVQSGSGL